MFSRIIRGGFSRLSGLRIQGQTRLTIRQINSFNGDAPFAVPKITAFKIAELLHCFQKSQILIQAHRYGIFDILEEKGKPVDVEELAEMLEFLPHTLERFLNACTSLEVLERTTKGKKVMFQNSPDTSIYLTRKSSFNVLPMIDFLQVYVKPDFDLEKPMRTGKQHLHETINYDTSTPEDFFKNAYGTKETFNVITNAMNGYSNCGIQILGDLDLKKYKNVVDLGGCLGTHARLIKRLNKDMTVTIADLKPIVDEARKQPENNEVGLKFEKCDFFDGSTLPKADLYILAHILHDWNDTQCREIMQNVFNAINKGGAVLILEKMLNPNKDGPAFACQLDLVMMALTDGKERTEEEYKSLLQEQGFQNLMMKKYPESVYYDAIMAHKI